MPENRLPPGQYLSRTLPVLHYGPVPRFKPDTWDFRIFGATASGREHRWGVTDFADLPRRGAVADFHCVTRFSVLDNDWEGVPAAAVLGLVPPAPEVTRVIAWAEFGYSASMRVSDLAEEHALLATHLDGAPLTPEHGYPLRLVVPHLYAWKSVKWVRAIEYVTDERHGFWEDRGYHAVGDPWREQRYAYQDLLDDEPAP